MVTTLELYRFCKFYFVTLYVALKMDLSVYSLDIKKCCLEIAIPRYLQLNPKTIAGAIWCHGFVNWKKICAIVYSLLFIIIQRCIQKMWLRGGEKIEILLKFRGHLTYLY